MAENVFRSIEKHFRCSGNKLLSLEKELLILEKELLSLVNVLSRLIKDPRNLIFN